jgi:galactokinase
MSPLRPAVCRYRVRDATQHPIWENHRVNIFRQVLLAMSTPMPATEPPIDVDGLFSSMAATSPRHAKMLSLQHTASATARHRAADKCSRLSVSQQLDLLGELMLQSHASYTRVGLGSQGTDRLVALARRHMRPLGSTGNEESGGSSAAAVHGAKITGGGVGGMVCVLAQNDPAGEAAVQAIVQDYGRETSHTSALIGQSSMGAMMFDHLIVRLRDVQG